jgi:putative peptide zinc metalloprotease protein
VRAVDPVAVSVLDVPALASVNGGPVAVEGQTGPQPGQQHGATGRSALAPVEAVYRISLNVEPATIGPAAAGAMQDGPERVTRGIVRVTGEARSIAERFWRMAASVLIRETGF